MLCCPVLVASCGLRPSLLGSELDSGVIALFNWRSDPLGLESRTSDVVWLAAAAVGATMGIGNAAVAASIPRMPLPVSLAGGTVTKAGRSASLLAWVCGLLIGLFSSPALRVDFLQVPPLLAHFGSWPNLEMLSSRRGSGLAKIQQLRAVAHPAGRRFQFFGFCYCTSFLSRKRAEVALLGLY